MSLRVIEGTWEEIELHKHEFVGLHLRVTVTDVRPKVGKTKAATRTTHGYGMLKGVLSTTEYLLDKRVDSAKEDRLL